MAAPRGLTPGIGLRGRVRTLRTSLSSGGAVPSCPARRQPVESVVESADRGHEFRNRFVQEKCRMKADSSYLVACAARNGPHDLAREALPGEVPRGPCVSPATLHDRTRPVDLGLERGECALDELRGNACGGELVPDERIACAPPREGRGAILREPPIVEEPGGLEGLGAPRAALGAR